MSEIHREVLFGKLNTVAYQTLESATLLGKMRGNPYVELVHWIAQLLEHTESDWMRVVTAFDLDPARLAADLTAALEKLPRGASAVRDLSPQIDLTVERAWVYASLLFGATRVRTGHVLFAALKTPELAQALRGISRQLDKLGAEELARRFESILGTAPEAAQREGAKEQPASEDGAPAPALMGKQQALQRYATDLTERARSGQIDPLVGRDQELRQVVDILMRRRQNNPLLTGEAGVGKTAVVEALAQRIASGDVPAQLRDVVLYSLDLGMLQAGASMKGEFEQRLRQVIEEVEASPRPIILFVDEAHTLIGAGGAAGTGDAANLLKPALARGTLRTIAATTWAEYKKHIEKDPALTRRFQVVQVGEPSEALALRMIRGVATTLEAHHRVQILDDALDAAVRLSHRYIPARQLPDKAVSLLDTACARVAVSQQAVPAAVEDSRRSVEALATELARIAEEAVIGADVESRRADALAARTAEEARLAELERRWRSEKAMVDRVLAIRARLRVLAAEVERKDEEGGERARLLSEQAGLTAELTQLQGEGPLVVPTVDRQAVSAVVSDWTGIPVGRMLRDEIETVLALPDVLARRVIGQAPALEAIARRIQMSRAGLEDPRKPIGVFLLAGPSGVGKTETALALAEALYGGEQSLVTINMSEFQEAHTVSTLKGAPPGYVGYGEGGVLTEAVRRRPYCVVLLDEIEKAHPDVHELFFQVFDKGVMEDGEGRSIDFKNTLILLTTNVGSELLLEAYGVPGRIPRADSLAEALREPLREVFPAALLGRMVTVPYAPLSSETLHGIVQLSLARVALRVKSRHGAELRYEDGVADLIAARCTTRESGARTVEALLSSALLPRLSSAFLAAMLAGEPVHEVSVGVSQGELTCRFA